MKQETFFEKFDQFADAPDAVAKMRVLILELAVQGKLVGQKLTEGNGHALLEQIHNKNPPSHSGADGVKVDSEPASFPSSWAPSKLGEVAEIIRGVTFPGSAKSETRSNGDVACLRTASVQAEIDWDDLIYISPTHVSREDQWVMPNDIMISMANSYALVGKVAIVREVPQKATFGAFLAAIRPVLIEPYFLLYVLRSPRMQAAFRASSSQTTNIANISLGRMRPLPFPLPPLAEQKRIVEKINELMALCDRLEAQQQDRETRNTVLARAALTRFANAPTSDNLKFVFHESYDIAPADLRKSILTLAFKGKLVRQDINEESAKATEKHALKLNSNKNKWAGSIGELEVPYQLPKSWKWLRLGDLASLKHGYAFSGEFFTNKPTPYVLTTPGNFYEQGGFRDRESKRRYFSGSVEPEFILSPGDLIIPMTEQAAGLLGSPAFIPDNGMVYIHNQRLGKISFTEAIEPEFAFWFFNSEFFRGELARTCTGMKVRHTSPDRVLRVPFPVCSLPEQRRIVAKVELMIDLVSELETQLLTSRTAATNLLSALVAELTVPA